ncbi:MAG TPA: metalloregulator ArsR/SmtB family transcription factor [Thermoanaerobaculia bacterium]|nr:metalloregulator ArsR/SmtB family transcription factor [Thermoanaerobaculia bacterium]
MNEPSPLFDHLSVLADATRARLLLLLEAQALSVSELCAVVQQPQSTVSRHLKVLTDGGWLTVWREGTSRLYRLRELAGPARRLWELLREETVELPAARQDRGRLSSVLRERRTRSREFFATTAGEWDRLRRELFGAGAELGPLLGLLDPAWTVGDLGCGTGRSAEALAPFVARVVAVDESPEMLAAAELRLAGGSGRAGLRNVVLRRGTLEALPVADGELDAAVLGLVLHHLAEPAAVLVEAARALAPGGRLLVVDMLAHDRAEYRRAMGHQWLGFEPATVEAWLAAAGFEAARTVALPPDPQAAGPNLFAATAVLAAAAGRPRATARPSDEPVPELAGAAGRPTLRSTL